VVRLLNEQQKVSETFIEHAQNIKGEMFGKEVATISEYELKLMYSGFEMAKVLTRNIKQQSDKGIQDLMKAIFNAGKPGE
jgi:hypothetical protein